MKNFKIKFSPLGEKNLRGSTVIYAAESSKHAINILNSKRRSLNLKRAWIINVKEVTCL